MRHEETFIAIVTLLTPAAVTTMAGDAHAAPLESSVEELRIVGGEPTKTCHFPSTVSMSGGCTGTLVHPQIVTTAKHCIGRSQTMRFGENENNLTHQVKATCKSWQGSGDMGYCKLEKPVTDVPIVPILMGCELEALNSTGLDVALVGFGRTSGKKGTDDYGTKRQVLTPLIDVPGAGGGNVKDAEILVGNEEKGACNGDSGGPAFIDLREIPEFKDKPGAGWRVFGVTSRPGPGAKICLGSTVYGMIHKMVDWIEEDSGIDITPCFDADGTWNPNEECKDFPDPEAGGEWDTCDPGQLSGYSHVCGDNPNDQGGDGSGDGSSGDSGEGDGDGDGDASSGTDSSGEDSPDTQDPSGSGDGSGDKDDTSGGDDSGKGDSGDDGSDNGSDDGKSKDKSDDPNGDKDGSGIPGCAVDRGPGTLWAGVIAGFGLILRRRRKSA